MSANLSLVTLHGTSLNGMSGTILVPAAHLQHYLFGESCFLEKFPQMAGGIHFVFGKRNHGSLEVSW